EDVFAALLDAVRATYPALVARCIDEAGHDERMSSGRREAVQKQLLADLRDPRIHLRARIEAGLRLGRIGDPRFQVVRNRRGAASIRPALCEVEGGRELVGNPDERSDPRYDPEAYADEQQGKEGELETFWVGRYPVTNAEFRRFVRAGGYTTDE